MDYNNAYLNSSQPVSSHLQSDVSNYVIEMKEQYMFDLHMVFVSHTICLIVGCY